MGVKGNPYNNLQYLDLESRFWLCANYCCTESPLKSVHKSRLLYKSARIYYYTQSVQKYRMLEFATIHNYICWVPLSSHS